MGPTYLVLLRAGDAALVLYDGKDLDEATAVHRDAYREQRDQAATLGKTFEATSGIYLVTVRAEARLS